MKSILFVAQDVVTVEVIDDLPDDDSLKKFAVYNEDVDGLILRQG